MAPQHFDPIRRLTLASVHSELLDATSGMAGPLRPLIFHYRDRRHWPEMWTPNIPNALWMDSSPVPGWHKQLPKIPRTPIFLRVREHHPTTCCALPSTLSITAFCARSGVTWLAVCVRLHRRRGPSEHRVLARQRRIGGKEESIVVARSRCSLPRKAW